MVTSEAHSLEEVLQQAAVTAKLVIPGPTEASAILWDDTREDFVLNATTVPGQPAQDTTFRVRRQGGATAWVVQHRRPLIVPDIAQDPFGANPMLLQYGLKAYAAVPVLVNRRALGVLYSLSYLPREYTPEEIARLEAVANLVALALQREQMLAQTFTLATTDELTGISRRGYALRLGERQFHLARRLQHALSVVMFDLDGFKALNDTFGHATGDLVLQAVGKIIREQTRPHDIVGRYGGEEFLLILPGAGIEEAIGVVQRILHAVRHLKLVPGRTITLSAGIAALTPETPNLADLIQRADQALYQAKALGGNTWVVEPSSEPGPAPEIR